jgi:hypothetical protein
LIKLDEKWKKLISRSYPGHQTTDSRHKVSLGESNKIKIQGNRERDELTKFAFHLTLNSFVSFTGEQWLQPSDWNGVYRWVSSLYNSASVFWVLN